MVSNRDNTPSNGSPSTSTKYVDQATGKSELITLQVGERRFTTLRDTLVNGSGYFAARLSDRWHDVEEDGSYFVDADPELFKHILQFLRRGNFPRLFVRGTQVLDHALYKSLLAEAEYFVIRELAEWIKNESYLDAVQVTRTITTVTNAGDGNLQRHLDNLNPRQHSKVDMAWGTRKVYVCPRGIVVHRGDPDRCGQGCKKVRERNGGGVEFEDEPVATAIITTTELKLN